MITTASVMLFKKILNNAIRTGNGQWNGVAINKILEYL